MTTSPTFILYSRVGCHLCEDMEQHLRELQQQHLFNLEVVDIDRDPRLQTRYNTQIPVLVAGAQELCHYYLDQAGFLRYLQDFQSS